MNNTTFSHRPLAGVSVGVISDGENLYFAAALVNDGTSRNHIFHTDRRDSFSRPIARRIINCRLMSLLKGENINFGFKLPTRMSEKEFMDVFREGFKPDIEEGDDFLVDSIDLGDVGIPARFRARANEIWNRISNLANEIAANTEVSA